jgi:hypothetical protein
VSGDRLTIRALNRALLARQLLLKRSPMSPAKAIEHLVGVQAQIPNSPYIGLWTRLNDFRPDELAELVITRRVLRGSLLRGTLHLVTARDYLILYPLVRPVMERALKSNFAKRLAGLDVNAIAAAGRALLEKQPRSGAELSKLLQERWRGRDAHSLGYAVQYLSPLVQLPPRGVWGKNGQVRWTTARAWIGRRTSDKPSADKLVRRYLAAFGPATVMDIRAWSGIAGLREVTERLRRRLRTFRSEAGGELFDLPDAPRPDPDTPAPSRFLPYYDNALLGHADRSRIIAPDGGMRFFATAGLLVGTILVDGFLAGRWKVVRDGKGSRHNRVTLLVEYFDPIRKPDRAALAEEGHRLLNFAAPDACKPDVRVVRAST